MAEGVALTTNHTPAVAPPGHLSQQAQHFIRTAERVSACDLGDPAILAELRAATKADSEGLLDAVGGDWISHEDAIDGVPVVWFAPSSSAIDSGAVAIHFHGGGYIVGDPFTSAAVPVGVALRTGLAVASVDYRLAPEHQCPAALEDCFAVANSLAASRPVVALFGESAGGGLTLAVAIAMRDAGTATADCLGLISPWVDMACEGDSYRTMAGPDPVFDDITLWTDMGLSYSPDPSDPRHTLLNADLRDLPPALIQAGGREILLSDSCRIHEVLEAAGNTSTLDVWDGLWHAWHLDPAIPEAHLALDSLVDFYAANSPNIAIGQR